MIASTDIAPFAGTVGGGFFLGFIAGYAIKKVMRLAAIIIGLFVAALAYLEYQRILSVDWTRIQVVLQNGITWLTDAITLISNTIGTTHSGTLLLLGSPRLSLFWSNVGIGERVIINCLLCLLRIRPLSHNLPNRPQFTLIYSYYLRKSITVG